MSSETSIAPYLRQASINKAARSKYLMLLDRERTGEEEGVVMRGIWRENRPRVYFYTKTDTHLPWKPKCHMSGASSSLRPGLSRGADSGAEAQVLSY